MTVLDHSGLMDRVYRRQRHFYDLTRKYYLLGRDPMIAGLKPPAGGSVLEIGCGTGRNLVKAARAYPQVSMFGIDISRGMLETAGKAVTDAGLRGRVRIAYADAQGFDPLRTFGQAGFDRIFISYAVSMIPSWREVMADAFAHLAPGGELHVVDFGGQERLPGWFRSGLSTWLGWYHVTPRPDLFAVARQIATDNGRALSEQRLYRGFAWLAVLRKPVS